MAEKEKGSFKETVKDAKESKIEKEIELKVKAEKISEEHLLQLQNVVNGINNMQFSIGRLENQKHQMLHNLSIAQDRVGVLQDTLQKEYGTYDVNLDDGTINWPEDKPEVKDEK